MRLAAPPEIHRSTNFKQQMFDIGDTRIILEILRSKMYSRPIYVIVQEIMSNSRDAHREVGTPDTPVEVIISTFQTNQISFRDYGPGISPDRMENVYLKYGNSTKRADDVQTGGFGLGAKTPFAYTDSFNITTITDKKRTYIAYIDESNKGAVSLVSEEDTEEPTGTTITLPVKGSDIEQFAEAVETIGKFWNPRPKVICDVGFNYAEMQERASGTGWTYYQKDIPGFRRTVILVDGIPYSLREEALGDIDSNLRKLASNPKLALNFGVGELQVTANREDLDYQQEVVEKVVNRLRVVFDEMFSVTQTEFDALPNLIVASREAGSLQDVYTLFGVKLRWRGIPLVDSRVPDWHYYDEAKKQRTLDSHHYIVRNYILEKGRVASCTQYRTKQYDRKIYIEADTIIVEDDIGSDKPNKRRLETLLEAHRRVCVVTFASDEARQLVCDHFHFDKWDVPKLSSFTEAVHEKASRSKYTVSRVKERTSNKWVSTARTTADANGGAYVILDHGRPHLTHATVLSNKALRRLQDCLGMPIFGVLSKYSKSMSYHSSWVPLFDVIKTRLREIRNSEEFHRRIALGKLGKTLPTLKGIRNKLPNDFKEYLELLDEVTEATNQSTFAELNELHDILGKRQVELDSGLICYYNRKLRAKYPMVRLVSDFDSKREDLILLQYLRNIDKTKERA